MCLMCLMCLMWFIPPTNKPKLLKTSTMLTMLACQKDQFQLEENHTYLNCAYMSPLLKRVEQVGIEGLLLKRRPYKISSEDFFTTGAKG